MTMNKHQVAHLIYAIMITFITSNCWAERGITHNGFLTAGFSQTDNEVSFIGVTDDANFSDLSLIAVQTTFRPSDGNFQFVTQLLARGNNAWNVDAEWAYIGARLTDSFEFQAGKIRVPMFMISETIDVGITYPWIRPPEELYGFSSMPFTAINGLKIKNRGEATHFDYNFLVYVGENPSEAIATSGLEYVVELKIAGVEVNLVRDNLRVRVSYHDVYDLDLDFSAALAANPSLAALFSSIPGGRLEGSASFATLGTTYNDNRFLFMSEVGERKVAQSSINQNWFVTFGYQLGRYLPHVTHSVGNLVDSVATGNIDTEQKSTIVGVKVSLTPALAFKAELARSELTGRPGNVGLFDVLPIVAVDDEVDMVNLAINMVF